MTHLDLTQEEDEALATALRRIIADDRYPLSPRVLTLPFTSACRMNTRFRCIGRAVSIVN
jgi:hypothetical protein